MKGNIVLNLCFYNYIVALYIIVRFILDYVCNQMLDMIIVANLTLYFNQLNLKQTDEYLLEGI